MVHCLDTANSSWLLWDTLSREGELLPTLDDIACALDVLLRTCNITSEVQLGKLHLNEFLVKTHLLLPEWAGAWPTTAWAVVVQARVAVLYTS